MANLREQAKTSIPRALQNSLTRNHNTLDAEKDQFERDQANAVTKALSIIECPVKEKHLRTIIIGTFKQKSTQVFWTLVSTKAPLHGNPIVCWKFLHVLHKVLREGHERSVKEALRHVGLLQDLGKLWGHLKEGYGLLIALYAKLIIVKLQFHERNPPFPGNLSMDRDALMKLGQGDAGNFYELCIELLDYMDEILSLEKGVFSSLDMSKANSMTNAGQCRLAPLIVCIQDSVHLYDYTVKLLFLLHQHLPPDTLSGHTARFLAQFVRLRKFYLTSSNLQYFKHLVQIPSLPESPPNFLVASNLSSHVTPVVVVPEQPEEPELNDSMSDLNSVATASDDRDRYIDQLLMEIENLSVRMSELEEERRVVEGDRRDLEDRLGEERSLSDKYRAEAGSASSQVAALTAMVQEAQQLQMATSMQEDRNKTAEEKFGKLKEVYQKLREEHINLLRLKAEVDKKLASSNINKDEAVRAREKVEKEVEGMLSQITNAKDILTRSSQEQDTQIHNLQATLLAVQTKLADAENEVRQKEETSFTLERQLHERDNQILQMKVKHGDAEQNKTNVEMELIELNGKLNMLTSSTEEQLKSIEELNVELLSKTEQLNCRSSELEDCRQTGERGYLSAIEAALAMMENIKRVEDIETITCSVCSLNYQCRQLLQPLTSTWPQDQAKQVGLVSQFGDSASLVWGFSRGVSSTCSDIDLGLQLSASAEELINEFGIFIKSLEQERQPEVVEDKMVNIKAVVDAILNHAESISGLGKEEDLASLVVKEIAAMDAAIEEAAAKIEELLAASRAADSGKKLEVNEKILDSCTSLVAAIKELVMKSKVLQQEILSERQAQIGEKEFYKKNSRWTEGLISAAKAVGLGAKLLVDAADRVVLGNGNFEEIMVASQEIAGSTAQLVIASRVKARDGSEKFNQLRAASKVVTQATGGVVAVAKSCTVNAEEEELNFSGFSAHQTKTYEMESQVRLLKLEADVEAERKRLAQLRRQHYKTGVDSVQEAES